MSTRDYFCIENEQNRERERERERERFCSKEEIVLSFVKRSTLK